MKMYILAFYSSKSVHYFKADLNTYFNKSPTSPPPQAGVVALQRPGLKLFHLTLLKFCQVFGFAVFSGFFAVGLWHPNYGLILFWNGIVIY